MRRTATGDVPCPPTTGGLPLLVPLHPAMLSTVMLISPGFGSLDTFGSTPLMKACMKPTTFTGPGEGVDKRGAIMGIVTIEILDETRLPAYGFPGYVPPVICGGPDGNGKESVSCWLSPAPEAWVKHSAPAALGPLAPPGLGKLDQLAPPAPHE